MYIYMYISTYIYVLATAATLKRRLVASWGGFAPPNPPALPLRFLPRDVDPAMRAHLLNRNPDWIRNTHYSGMLQQTA